MKCQVTKCFASVLMVIVGTLVVATSAAFSGRYEAHNAVGAAKNHTTVMDTFKSDHKKTFFGLGSNRAPPAHDTPSGTCNCRKGLL